MKHRMEFRTVETITATLVDQKEMSGKEKEENDSEMK